MTNRPRPPAPSELAPSVRTLVRLEEADRLGSPDLSEFFNPFLAHFVHEAVEGRLDVRVAEREGRVVGISTYDVVENVGAIFARDPTVAETLFGLCPAGSVFSDFPFGTGSEAYDVYSMALNGGEPAHRFSHRLRIADQGDRDAVLDLMGRLYGRVRGDWIRGIPRTQEPCFLAEVDGEIAGVGWVTALREEGRLHALSVRPRYRRMGVGIDLWHARMLWARRVGVRRVICEIGEHNAPSRAIATAGGMHPVGRIFLSHRPVGPSGA
ncbi:MAG: GNAT family N-acetyltransferase [Thermoplasmata archaeon]